MSRATSFAALVCSFALGMSVVACSAEPGSDGSAPPMSRTEQGEAPNGETLTVGDSVDVAEFQRTASQALIGAGTFTLVTTLSSDDPNDPGSVTTAQIDISDPNNGRSYSRTNAAGDATSSVIVNGKMHMSDDGEQTWTEVGDANVYVDEYTAWLAAVETLTFDGNQRLDGANVGRYIATTPDGSENTAFVDDDHRVVKVEMLATVENDGVVHYRTVHEFRNFGKPVELPDVS